MRIIFIITTSILLFFSCNKKEIDAKKISTAEDAAIAVYQEALDSMNEADFLTYHGFGNSKYLTNLYSQHNSPSVIK